jgi:hypothetical protein
MFYFSLLTRNKTGTGIFLAQVEFGNICAGIMAKTGLAPTSFCGFHQCK